MKLPVLLAICSNDGTDIWSRRGCWQGVVRMELTHKATGVAAMVLEELNVHLERPVLLARCSM